MRVIIVGYIEIPGLLEVRIRKKQYHVSSKTNFLMNLMNIF